MVRELNFDNKGYVKDLVSGGNNNCGGYFNDSNSLVKRSIS